ncbi:hypothetical protein [Dactylosporangium sp. CA-092794]|uniref:hypothetical protein n=1 Tax=Dactylosporangium sp. CA-092794 TaxID=3239929 RepID=UPI003D9358BF
MGDVFLVHAWARPHSCRLGMAVAGIGIGVAVPARHRIGLIDLAGGSGLAGQRLADIRHGVRRRLCPGAFHRFQRSHDGRVPTLVARRQLGAGLEASGTTLWRGSCTGGSKPLAAHRRSLRKRFSLAALDDGKPVRVMRVSVLDGRLIGWAECRAGSRPRAGFGIGWPPAAHAARPWVGADVRNSSM